MSKVLHGTIDANYKHFFLRVLDESVVREALKGVQFALEEPSC